VGRIGTTLEGVEACVQAWRNKLLDPSYGERFREWILKEYPQHEVEVDAFSLGRYPVTNGQYAQFIDHPASPVKRTHESMSRAEPDDHPVWGVSLKEAGAYADWLTRVTGGRFRIPSEYEWEYAARGSSGREYPFGDVFDARCCNTFEAGIGHTTPVDRYEDFASELGVVDMAGNVEEWTSSWYAPYPGGTLIDDDISRSRGQYPILRGGSFARGGDLARCARRHGPHPGGEFRFTGFRVASDP
jgi:formylglycine-generating enzyme required for sulfatase activity